MASKKDDKDNKVTDDSVKDADKKLRKLSPEELEDIDGGWCDWYTPGAAHGC